MVQITRTLHKQGWRIELDRNQIFADNPGEGTPAMLYGPDGECATFFCALDTAETEEGPLPYAIHQWLDECCEQVDAFLA